MDPLVWYVIREAGTGRWLPTLTGTKRSGGRRPTKKEAPRLFTSYQNAKRCVTMWQRHTTYDLEIVPVVVCDLLDYNLLASTSVEEPERGPPLCRLKARLPATGWSAEKWRQVRKQRRQNYLASKKIFEPEKN